MSNDQNTTGYRVIDHEGGTHEFPDARSVHVDCCDLYLTDENRKTVAIFQRWEHVERITPSLPATIPVFKEHALAAVHFHAQEAARFKAALIKEDQS